MKRKVQGMKKWGGSIAVFLLALAAVMMLDVFSTSALAATGKTTSKVNIRQQPDTGSTAVGSAAKNATIEVLSQTTGADGKVWYKIQVDANTTGYIRSDLLTITDGSTPPTEGNSTAAEGNSGSGDSSNGSEQVTPVSATVTGNTIRVRTSASTSTSNNILTTVAGGTTVTVVAKTTGDDKKVWYQVKFTSDGKEVIGYIRNDYLTLSGEITPLSEETVATAPEETPAETVDPTPAETTETVEPKKRYETKLMNDKWYILDYEASQQYDIDQLFSAAKEYKALYEEAEGKAKSMRSWMFFFLALAVAGFAAAAYLLYRLKESKEEAFIASIENSTPRRTADRPRNAAKGSQQGGREKPVIKEGMESRREEGRGQVQNGQRSTPNRAQQNAQKAAAGQAPQRQGSAQQAQQRAAGGQAPQRPAGVQQNAQRPAGGQMQQRPAGTQQNAQRPVGAQPQGGRPQQTSQRPVGAPQNAQRQGGAQQPVRTAAKPQGNQAPQQPAGRAKNFVQDNDEREFEFLNWDSDE